MRLIDADELMEHAWRDKLDSRELIAEMIDNAPIVKEIPTKIPINVFEQLISRNSVIDKIRAEIEELQTYKMFVGEKTVYIERDDVLAIIDKCRAESEETDASSD